MGLIRPGQSESSQRVEGAHNGPYGSDPHRDGVVVGVLWTRRETPRLHQQQRVHKLLLGALRVGAELGPAAPAEAQQVQSVDGSAAGERVQVLDPKGDPASEAVQQDQRGSGPGGGVGGRTWLAKERQGPQIVFVGYADVLSGERLLHIWENYGTIEMGGKWDQVKGSLRGAQPVLIHKEDAVQRRRDSPVGFVTPTARPLSDGISTVKILFKEVDPPRL
ncbi:hypothetical protein EYF80_034915 [Liparis tanakae]|uniref:Uncharacterized protein n=1 Tax=Liparis tanakae TaxID=230148 RepID=A0A4Z2GP06_9TELE|nr:hypothetical protein EYF80_034915 [Liparis tanakae]